MELFGVEIKKCEDVYSPSDDTFLLMKTLRPYLRKGISFLEVGVGTGLISILAAKKGVEVTGIDLREESLECAKKNAKRNQVELTLKKSDLFSNIEQQFDLIAFNPPYLPASRADNFLSSPMKHALVGGETGKEVTIRFIKDVDNYLAREGLSFLIVSTRGNSEEIIDEIERRDFKVRKERKRHFFFEELIALKLKRKKK